MFFESIFLGILQGIFEWLPISSEGQIAAISLLFFGVTPEQAINFSVFLHTGTLIAALIYFRKDIKKIIFSKDTKLRNFLLIAVLATAITGIPSYIFLKQISSAPFIFSLLIAFSLIATGLFQKYRKQKGNAELNKKNSVLLGFAQGFSIIPGISRSGITTTALLVEGFSAEEALRISFILSIPSVAAAEIFFGTIEGFVINFEAIAALASAAIIGYISLHLILEFVKKIDFSHFCIALGLVYLVLSFL